MWRLVRQVVAGEAAGSVWGLCEGLTLRLRLDLFTTPTHSVRIKRSAFMPRVNMCVPVVALLCCCAGP